MRDFRIFRTVQYDLRHPVSIAIIRSYPKHIPIGIIVQRHGSA